MRALVKASVRISAATRSASSPVVSTLAERRLPLATLSSGGFQKISVRGPCGAPSWSIISISPPISVSRCSRGFPIVAESRMNWGELP